MQSGSKTKKFVLLFVLFILIFAAIEWVLRQSKQGSFSFWQPHQVYGKSLIPNARGWYTNEGQAYVRINSKGYHDGEHAFEKPADTFRIAVIGDSFVEALQLPYEKSFWYLLSEHLASCESIPVKINKIESLGFGVSNYGTATQLLLFQNEVSVYQPDWVVLSFFQANDITDNSRFFNTSPGPVFSMGTAGLELDTRFNQQASFKFRILLTKLNYYALFIKFRLLDLLRSSIKKAAYTIEKLNQSASSKQNDGLHASSYLRDYEEKFTQALELTQKLILELASQVNRNGTKFTLLSIPHSTLLHPDQSIFKQNPDQFNLPAYRKIDQQLFEFAQENEINNVRLTEALAPYANSTQNYLYGFENNKLGFGHFSEYGHLQTARVLADHICQQLKQ